jgi:ribose 5-phosphate isomerase RpiB
MLENIQEIIQKSYKGITPTVYFGVENGQLGYLEELFSEMRKYPDFIDDGIERQSTDQINVYSLHQYNTNIPMSLNYIPFSQKDGPYSSVFSSKKYKKTEMQPDTTSAEIAYQLAKYLEPITLALPVEYQSEIIKNIKSKYEIEYSVAPVKKFTIDIDKTGLDIYHANKPKHVRAITPLSLEHAIHCRKSGNANALVISAMYQKDIGEIAKIIHAFVRTPFEPNPQRIGIIQSVYRQKEI